MVTIGHREPDTGFIDELRRTCESTNINFLLGAGCSMPMFGTLGNIETLWAQLKTSETKEKIVNAHGNDANFIENLVEASLKASFFTTAILPNRAYIETDANDTKDNYESFCHAAMKLVAEREASTLPKQVTFFVSNYDICMDVALDTNRVPTNSGYVGRFNPVVDLSDFGRRVTTSTLTLGYQSEIASANLVKIHGCASWRKNGQNIEFSNDFELIKEIEKMIKKIKKIIDDVLLTTGLKTSEEPQDVHHTSDPLLEVRDELSDMIAAASKIAGGKTGKSVPHLLDKSLQDLLDKFHELQIVWPTKQKFHDTVLDETYYAQLRRLNNQLEVRNSVLIVAGFSFADEHIRKLILRAADTNPTLKVIILCYDEGSEEQIWENLEKESTVTVDEMPIANHHIITVTKRTEDCEIQGNLDLETITKLLEKVSK